MKQKRTVTHLQIGTTHKYFGSLAAIYTQYTPEQLGITYNSPKELLPYYG